MMQRRLFVLAALLLVIHQAYDWSRPIDWSEVTISGYFFQPTFDQDNNPIGRYLWIWIKYICYGLGGIAGAAGLIFGIFGFWVGRGQIIKQGIISTIAGFAFILVIPFVRIVFGQWVDFAEGEAYIPEDASLIRWGLNLAGVC